MEEKLGKNESHEEQSSISTPSTPLEESRRPKRTIRKNRRYDDNGFDSNLPGPSDGSQRRNSYPKRKKKKRGNDGIPDLMTSERYEDGDEEEEEGNDEDSSNPPILEINVSRRRRGRPKKPEEAQIPTKPRRIRIPKQSTHHDPIVSRKVIPVHQESRIFEEEVYKTPEGSAYARVVPGCQSELYRKDFVLKLLNDPSECENLKDNGWLISRPPRLPPFTNETGTFVFLVDGRHCKDAKELSIDDLRPWSTTPRQLEKAGIHIKPNVRRHPVAVLDGEMKIVRIETRLASYHLTEYSARLPRCERLRKKIFYLTRDHSLHGDVLIIYEYTKHGALPIILSKPHGNDHLSLAMRDQMESTDILESPFEDECQQGPEGGFFMQLRPNQLGWMSNKSEILDFLFNRPEIGHNIVVNDCIPILPPLIETVGVFAFFANGSRIQNQIHQTPDGLSPWSAHGPNDDGKSGSRVRSKRKPLFVDENGDLKLVRDNRIMKTEYCLTETITVLARCPRVRKRVIYITRNKLILGLVCYLYEFLSDGPVPEILPDPVELRRAKFMEDGHDVIDADNEEVEEKFEDDVIVDEELYAQWPDVPPGEVDNEFQNLEDEDYGQKARLFHKKPRCLSTGHVYLTMWNKKVLNNEMVLHWIANSDQVTTRNILNDTKPLHPPMIRNARAYAFFVAGNAIHPHEANKDSLSPWSKTGNPQEVCYRTKVKKCGVILNNTRFEVKLNGDWTSFPYHLVYLYSTCPRDPRLKKKIYYVMETRSRMIISHCMVIYDYHIDGELVPMSQPYSQRRVIRELVLEEPHQYAQKEFPFRTPAQQMADGTRFLEVLGTDFLNDRTWQLDFMFNKPEIVQGLRCVNTRVPDLPPHCTKKGTFAFFIDLDEVNCRDLTVDRLVPWSENGPNAPKRPKSSKEPLALNFQNRLRVIKKGGGPYAVTSYQLHTYTATLPRCSRLRKKVLYIQQDQKPVGFALLMYCYTDCGPMPEPLAKPVPGVEWLDPSVKSDVLQLLRRFEPDEVIPIVEQKHGVRFHLDMIMAMREQAGTSTEEEWPLEDEPRALEPRWRGEDGELGPDMIPEEMLVEAEEVIIQEEYDGSRRANFLSEVPPGYVRGNQRQEAMWRIAQSHYGHKSIGATFDELFRLLCERDEGRMMQQIENTFQCDMSQEGAHSMEVGGYMEMQSDEEEDDHDDDDMIHE